MKILLIGHKGMLGTALFERFREVYEVVGAGKAELDITDHDAVRKMVEHVKPTLVVNAAAYTDVDGAEKDDGRALAYAINGDACGNLAHYCREGGARLIHFSTDYVFNGSAEHGYDEDDTEHLGPLNVYGKSKLQGERLIADEMENYAIVRLSWLFGPDGGNFVDTMIWLGSDSNKKREELKVVNDQFGKPTYTLDVAEALEQLFDDTQRGAFHLPNEGATSWHDFAQEIFKKADIHVNLEPIPTSEFPRPAQRPHYSILNNTKLAAMRPWSEALDHYLQQL